MKALFDDRTNTWNIYPNGPVPYEFKKEQEVDSLGLGVQQQKWGGYVIHLANNAYRLTTKKEIVKYYHVAAGWPVKKTWIAAIQRNSYASWPGLDEYMIWRQLEVWEPIVLGHMNAYRSGTQTTIMKEKEKSGEEKMEWILAAENNSLEKPVPGILQSRKRQVGVHLVSFDELKGYIATDLCGVYPTMSNRGMTYILVLYDYDSNAILAKAMKNNKGQAITTAYEALHKELTEAGIT